MKYLLIHTLIKIKANRGENNKVKNPDDAQFVVKIEPKDNGPLFCETHFYINCAKEDYCKHIFTCLSGFLNQIF
jgi:hypothetical protein